jgi:PDZ domain
MGIIAIMTATALVVPAGFARVLGVSSFQLFDVRRPCPSVGKEVAIRTVGAIAPLLVAIGLFVVAGKIGGEQKATTTLEVQPGPAKQAGLEDGDRVLEIDGRPITSWDDILSTIRAKHDTHEIVVERGGARRTFLVPPNAEGRVGIASHMERSPMGWGDAFRNGFETPFRVVKGTFDAVTQPKRKADLAGPVGIVQTTSKASSAGLGAYLWVLALLGAYFWPAYVLLQLLDAGTLFAFQQRYPVDGDRFAEVAMTTWRVARLRQVLNGLVLLSGLFGGLVLVSTLFDWIPLVLVVLVLPGVWLAPVLFPVSWLLGKNLWGPAAAVVCLAGVGIPCLNLALLLVLSMQARAYMNRNGLANEGVLPQAPAP